MYQVVSPTWTIRDYLFAAIVVLNGDIPSKEFFDVYAGATIYCADGAAWSLRHIGIVPTYIIGDMDSFRAQESGFCSDQGSDQNYEVYFPESVFLTYADQDSNDFEKILRVVDNHGKPPILLCGMHGGELEHTLNNWSVFMRYTPLQEIAIYDESHRAKRLGIPVVDTITIATQFGECISIIPQPSAILTTHGLQWELDGEKLTIGEREGARNRATGESVRLSVHQGAVVCFVDCFPQL